MRKQLTSVAAILLSVIIFLVGNGLTGLLLPLRANLEGFTQLAIGLVGSAYFLGFMAGCFSGPHLLARIGHSRTFAVGAGLAAATTLLQSLWVSEIAWIVLRGVFGFAAACLFMAIESWLNDRATNETRGRIFAAYLTVNFTGLIVGQWLITVGRASSTTLFIVAAVFYALCMIPVALTLTPQPKTTDVPVLRPLQLYQLSPVGVAGCIGVGLANSAVWTFAPIYAQGLGMNKTMVALFMVIFTIGGALVQLPLGRLSDRMDRRYIIAGICIASATLGVLFFLFGASSKTAPLVFVAIFGMACLPLYGMSVAHANDRLPRELFVEASATLLLINSSASALGPVIAAIVTTRAGMSALFLYTASIHVLLLGFTLYRLSVSAAPAKETRDVFEPMPPAASPVALELDPRSPEHEDVQSAA
jgi:MFS family permease